jgi:hypothetical protein
VRNQSDVHRSRLRWRCDARRINDLRSTFASQALAAGVSVFELARIMDASVRMIELHWGALLQGSGEASRGTLDAYLDRFGQDRPRPLGEPIWLYH